jgi:multiple sugar transport system permease protein
MALNAATRVRRARRDGYAYLFVLPYVVLLLAFGIGPAAYAIATSFFDTTKDVMQFNGLANFASVLQDFRTGPAVLNVLAFMLIWLPLTLIGVLAFSLLLHARVGRFAATMRLIYYLPGAVTGSASVLLWLFMLDPLLSPFGPILNALGFQTGQDVLSTSNLPAVYAVMAFSTSVGFWIVVVFGALMNISHEILEAAIIDGCNTLQASLYIKVPLIAKYLIFMLILSFAGGIQLFVEPQIMSVATTGTTSDTWSINLLAYKYAFTDANFGTSAAVAVGLMIVGVAIALVIIFKTDFYSTETAER